MECFEKRVEIEDAGPTAGLDKHPGAQRPRNTRLFLPFAFALLCAGLQWLAFGDTASSIHESNHLRFVSATQPHPFKCEYLFDLSYEKGAEKGQTKRLAITWEGWIVEPENAIVQCYDLSRKTILVHVRRNDRDDYPALVAIIDADTGDIRDHFFATSGLLASPDGRYLVYKKAAYWRSAEDYQSNVVLVYDTNLPAEANRTKGRGVEPKFDVGIPVYPIPYSVNQAYFIELPPSPDETWVHRENPEFTGMASPFLWTPASDAVVFLAQRKDVTLIVRIDLAKGLKQHKAFERQLEVSPDMLRDGFDVYKKRVQDKDPEAPDFCSFVNLEWADSKHIRTKNRNYMFKEALVFEVP